MQLVLTGMGKELDFEAGHEKGVLVFNKGLLRIQIEDEEMKKVLVHFKSNPDLQKVAKSPSPQPPEEDFYIHPGTVLDDEVKADYYVQQPLDDSYYTDEDKDEDDYTDEDGIPEA